MPQNPFATPVSPDWEGLRDTIMGTGSPSRVHHIELFLDREVQDAIAERYDVLDGLNPADPSFDLQRQIAVQRFLGYDFVRCGVDGFDMPLNRMEIADTAELQRANGRRYMNEHKGPITSWEEFEAYPWPDPTQVSTRSLEWFESNLPDDMCIIGSGGFAHFAEYLTWLMGYESLCYALYDQRDLVEAIAERLLGIYRVILGKILEFDCVKIVWGSDDMGFRSGTLIAPDDARAYYLPGHKLMAKMSHDAGRPYLLHACGNLREIMDDLVEDVGIDAKHSFEDTIEDVRETHKQYGDRIAMLGGIDVDFLCRADESAIRRRVRQTLDDCLPRGRYVLGSGNSIANYIPVDNYMAMMDEGRNYRF